MTKMTKEVWEAKGVELFGEDRSKWVFSCPACGLELSMETAHVRFPSLKETKWRPESECVGRYVDGVSCDWAAWGLFAGPVFVKVDEDHIPAFDFGGVPFTGRKVDVIHRDECPGGCSSFNCAGCGKRHGDCNRDCSRHVNLCLECGVKAANMKAFTTVVDNGEDEFENLVAAETASKARYFVAEELAHAWGCEIKEGLCSTSVRRAPWSDHKAVERGIPGYIR